MKLHCLMAMLIGAFPIFSEGSKTDFPESVKHLKPKVIIRMLLGAPPPSCSRFGICQLELFPGWMRTAPGEAQAECFSDETGTQLTLYLNEMSGADPETRQKYFGNGYFLLETDVAIPPDVANALQINYSSVIAAGRYEIRRYNGILTFVVRLKQ